jgi:rhodanese-related sulfurtransferase
LSHDVFVSHSSLDKLAADAVCHGLEAKGIRCWIAPRDQVAGRAYGEQITAAIENAQVMVLVFSDHVNNSQAVLNEINIAAGSNVTIVPFRIAAVDFNSELHFYLGRMHWLDAFPQPVTAYIDTLAATIQRNLKTPAPGAVEGAAAAAAVVPPPPPPQPPRIGLVATHPPGAYPPVAAPRTGVHPGVIVGGVLGALFLILLIVLAWPRPPNPAAARAANTITQALANSIAKEADDDDDDDKKPAATPLNMPKGDGSELNPISAGNAAQVNYYETLRAPGGPPAQLDGATVIDTHQLLASLRDRDAGKTAFYLIDARGCGDEPTIPTAICLFPSTLEQLRAKVPDKSFQLVIFCHDGGCPLSYQLASAALAAGYSNVFWYRGGVNAWAAAGEPTAPSPGVQQ